MNELTRLTRGTSPVTRPRLLSRFNNLLAIVDGLGSYLAFLFGCMAG